MKPILKRYLKNLVFFVNKNPISQIIYNREINYRNNLPFTDIISLSKSINMFSPYTSEIHQANDWYAHARNIKKYFNLPQTYQFKFIIEHAPYLTEQVSDIELETNLPTYITSNDYRAGILKRYRPNAFSIGPLIHYADSFYSQEEIKSEKKRLGKNILVFPSHSLTYLVFNYNQNWFLNKLKSIAKDYHSVRICLYWIDIQMGLHKYYQDFGFECVTAGHIIDPNFLPRLKSLIEISDLTVSNDASTHVGYCVYLKKPHIIFHKFPKLKTDKKWKDITKDFWSSKPYQEVLAAFSEVHFNITANQQNIADLYFGGINNIKSKQKFRELVDKTEKIYQDLH